MAFILIYFDFVPQNLASYIYSYVSDRQRYRQISIPYSGL